MHAKRLGAVALAVSVVSSGCIGLVTAPFRSSPTPEAAATEGAQRSDSGLVMVVLTPGDGPSPAPTDRVRVHYHGTLRDGTVFTASSEGVALYFPPRGF